VLGLALLLVGVFVLVSAWHGCASFMKKRGKANATGEVQSFRASELQSGTVLL
jgi:hypothetical protein